MMRRGLAGLAALPRFGLERHPGWLSARFELSSSDCAPLSLRDALAMADDECAAWWRDLSLGYPADERGHPLPRAEIAKHHGDGGSDDSDGDFELPTTVRRPQKKKSRANSTKAAK